MLVFFIFNRTKLLTLIVVHRKSLSSTTFIISGVNPLFAVKMLSLQSANCFDVFTTWKRCLLGTGSTLSLNYNETIAWVLLISLFVLLPRNIHPNYDLPNCKNWRDYLANVKCLRDTINSFFFHLDFFSHLKQIEKNISAKRRCMQPTIIHKIFETKSRFHVK